MSAVIDKKNIENEMVYDVSIASHINNEPAIPELTEPLRLQAVRALEKLISEKKIYIQDSVFDDLVEWYGKIIARLTNNLLIQRYSSYFLAVYPYWRPGDSRPGDCITGGSRDILDEYIHWESEQNFLSGCGPYPELNRLLTLALKNWTAVIDEFFSRMILHADEMNRFFGSSLLSLDKVKSVDFGISDSHDQGRTAAILDFGPIKLVYKPRSLDGEFGWNYILSYLITSGLEYDYFLPKVLNFDGYGFMEFVEPGTCDHRQEVALCYEKYGAILAVAHAFGTYDLHHENIIVRKDSPVVIDAEPLFRCLLRNSETGERRLKLDRSISLENIDSSASVMDIGMLPHAIFSQLDKDGRKSIDYISGALYSSGSEPMKDYVVCGRGSDNLQMLEKTFIASSFPNLPTLDHVLQLPGDYLSEIEKGFRAAYHFLLKKKQDIIYKDLLLEQLRHLKLRLLVRPTVQYGIVFTRSISIQLLKSHEKRKQKIIEDLQILGKLRIDDIGNIEIHEVDSIMNGDIPRFEVIAESEEAYETPLMFSPLAMAKRRLESINNRELELQVVTIKEKIADRTKSLFELNSRPFESGQQTDKAFEIIRAIVAATIWKDEAPLWTYTSYAPGYGCTMVHADPEALYDGGMGTAVVIAEAGRLAGNEEWMSIAKKVIEPFRKGNTPVSVARGGGLARGLGGVIYAIVRIGDAVNDPEIIRLAINLALKHYKAVFEKEELDEVLHGRSGFLLSMIALYKRCPGPLLESIIEDTAQSLIKRSVVHHHGNCWKVLDGNSLPNVSHGTSGMAMALARWYELSGDTKAKNTLLGAMEYDNSFWSVEENGWIDARVDGMKDEQKTTWAWCNGRSGGLLARLAVSQAIGTPFSDVYSHNALCAGHTDILKEAAPGLCCGTAGALDALLKIKEYHPGEMLSEHINQATRIISRHSPESHYSNLMPALFTGSAGLAFGLMRAANPDRVKSMLWFG
ncbi:type 2 lanthipeptide synthetase LanM family protein [Chitinophaga sp. S165]|uniref:type 2 lanthipeptide synthetase LanM family protein n=1 Tax=Chitinophaga sp. S165 TaxID=2135462 RepID=UPI000D7119AF|nr:type 2 lanthipeptide synthetase LanM family protein [Chitinophaga sp. S165]PWV45381.1 type 2 lantibiotic biosynthesis protein LanM [Chitinophaga sp. S165]